MKNDKTNPLLSLLSFGIGAIGGALGGHAIGGALTKQPAIPGKESGGAVIGALIGMLGGTIAGMKIADRAGWSEAAPWIPKRLK